MLEFTERKNTVMIFGDRNITIINNLREITQ